MSHHSTPRSQRPGGRGQNVPTRKELSLAIREAAPTITRSKADKLASSAVARQQAGLNEDPLLWALYEARHMGVRVLYMHGFDPTGESAVRNVMAAGERHD